MDINTIKFLALQELGRAEMPDFVNSDDNDVKVINNQYDFILSLALENYPWSFANAKVELTDPEEQSSGKYKYQYELPDDCLFVRGRYASSTYTAPIYRYEQIDKYIYCDNTSLFISYTKKVPESELPSYFIDYLKYLLASRLCYLTTGDTNLLSVLEERKEQAFANARNVDIRQKPVKKLNMSELLDVRL